MPIPGYLRWILRSFRDVIRANGTSENIHNSARLSVLTAISGFDNKRTNYAPQSASNGVYGDDAFFVSQTGSSCVLGVADGVGGWRAYGVDPGQFSRAVMTNCRRICSTRHFDASKPERLIAQGYEDVLTSKWHIMGSATLCILSLPLNEPRIYAASLGDSGYLVIRRGRVIQRSLHQKHTFNTPFQLACPPHPVRSGQFYQDLPNQAVCSRTNVEPGDLLVVGTDGLFDNLTETTIVQIVDSVKYPNVNPLVSLDRCARQLVIRARTAAFAPNSDSPFASEARRYGIHVNGGVPGDITVILGLVVRSEEFPSAVTHPQVVQRSSPPPHTTTITRSVTLRPADLESFDLAHPPSRRRSHSLPPLDTSTGLLSCNLHL